MYRMLCTECRDVLATQILRLRAALEKEGTPLVYLGCALAKATRVRSRKCCSRKN